MKSIFTCLLVLFSFCVSAQQCLIKEISLDQRNKQSTLVIEGRVTARHSFWNSSRNMIYTSNTVEVLKIFKGSITASSVEIITEGGTVGYTMIKAEPSLQLKQGMTGIFMLHSVKRAKGLPFAARTAPRFEVFGAVQGFLKYNLQDGTASDPFKKYYSIKDELYRAFSPQLNYKVVKTFNMPVVQPNANRINAIDNFSPATVTAGTGTVLTINGSGFGATRGTGTVGFRRADDGGSSYLAPEATQYLGWSNTQIVVEVPDGAGTGDIIVTQGITFTSASQLTVDYDHLNVGFDPGGGLVNYQTDHVDDNGTGGYTWRMNTAFAANAAASASFTRAFDSWRCGTNINWTIGATTTDDFAASDGTNIITFDDNDPLPGGVLGVCFSYWSGCSSGPDIVWYVNELDIIFDNGDNFAPLTWQFGTGAPTINQYDFESVALHELGHGHQLGHVIDPGAVMHYALFNGASARTLSATDLAGGSFVQFKSEIGNLCGPTAMTGYTGCSSLPITIGAVNAWQKGRGVQVEWINDSESEVHHYVVEESANGSAFTDGISVSPKGNNGQRAGYEWFDASVSNGNNYYRIKSVGYNGAVKHSGVVTVNFAAAGKTFSVYPNPVTGGILTASFNNLVKGKYRLSVYNTTGQEVASRMIVHGGGNAVENISLPGVASGVYSVRLQGNEVNLQQTVLIKAKNQ
jgi:hypothetical protein